MHISLKKEVLRKTLDTQIIVPSVGNKDLSDLRVSRERVVLDPVLTKW